MRSEVPVKHLSEFGISAACGKRITGEVAWSERPGATQCRACIATRQWYELAPTKLRRGTARAGFKIVGWDPSRCRRRIRST